MKTTEQQRTTVLQQLADCLQQQLQRLSLQQRKWFLLTLGLLMATCCAAMIVHAVQTRTYRALPQHFRAPRIAYPPDSTLGRGRVPHTLPIKPKRQDTIKK